MLIVTTLLRQVLSMFVMVALGYLLFRSGKISQDGSRALGNILIYLALPSVIINCFLIERTPEHIRGLGLSALAAALVLAVAVVLSHVFFKRDAIAAFSAAFSNPGFFGVPLIVATIGQDSVCYIAFFIAFLNILQWTYGVSIMTGQPALDGLKPRKLLKAPFVIALLVGLFLFFTALPLPKLLTDCLSSVAALNTPLAMFTIGIYLAQTDVPRMFRRTILYKVSLVRLLVIPLSAVLILSFFPSGLFDLKMAILLAVACPVGSNVAVYAQLHGKDYPYAVETVVISTLFSLLSIPALAYLASAIW